MATFLPPALPGTDRFLIDVFIAGITGTADRFIDETVSTFMRILGEIKRLPLHPIDAPFQILDAWISYVTGLVGLIVAFPFLGISRVTVKRILPVSGVKNKLMTAEKALTLPYEQHIAFVQAITFTSDNTLITWLVGKLAVLLYRIGKAIPFLFKLIQVRSEIEFVELMVSKYLQRLDRFTLLGRIFGAILGMLSILAFIGAQLNYLGLWIMILEGDLEKQFLAQDSRRKGGTRKGQHRINRRRGKDF